MSSPLDSSVTLGDALELVEARRIPIAPEVAGYLCLELAERALMQPGGLLPEGIFLGEEGSVAFVPRADAEPPEHFVRTLLRRLLEASASRPAALWQCTTGTRPGLDALVRELEAALIPLNRMASRRSLARLAREVKRVTQGVGRNAPSSVRQPPASVPPKAAPGAKLPPVAAPPPRAVSVPPPALSPSSRPPPARSSAPPARTSAIDELLNALDPIPTVTGALPDDATRWRLKEMAGLEPTPPPPTVQAPPSEPPADESPPTEEEGEAVEALLAAAVSGPQGRLAEAMRPSRPEMRFVQVAPKPEPRPVASSVLRARDSSAPPPAHAETQAELPHRPLEHPLRRSTPPGLRPQRSTGRGGTVAGAVLLVVLLTFGLVYWQKPEWMLGHKLPAPVPSTSVTPPAAPLRTCAIRVVGAPERTEILLLQGHTPLDVTPMPAGARIEFVGLLAGHAPKRAAIPAQAKWDPDPQGRPRYELAFELAPSRKRADPWPPTEPDTVVGGEGEPGTVRVVSSPRDAEVWLLFGAGPEAEISPVPCAAHEVLIASGTQLRTRVRIAADDFAAGSDGGPALAVVDAARKGR